MYYSVIWNAQQEGCNRFSISCTRSTGVRDLIRARFKFSPLSFAIINFVRGYLDLIFIMTEESKDADPYASIDFARLCQNFLTYYNDYTSFVKRATFLRDPTVMNWVLFGVSGAGKVCLLHYCYREGVPN